jgi:hypothetical protein
LVGRDVEAYYVIERIRERVQDFLKMVSMLACAPSLVKELRLLLFIICGRNHI